MQSWNIIFFWRVTKKKMEDYYQKNYFPFLCLHKIYTKKEVTRQINMWGWALKDWENLCQYPATANRKKLLRSLQLKRLFQLSVLFKTTVELGTCNITLTFLELKIRITCRRVEGGGGHPGLSERRDRAASPKWKKGNIFWSLYHMHIN